MGLQYLLPMRPLLSALGFALFGLAVFAQDGKQIITDPGFESERPTIIGPLAICTIIKNGTCVSSPDLIRDPVTGIGAPNSGIRYIQLGGRGSRQASFLIEILTIPSCALDATLRFQLQIRSADSTRSAFDLLQVEVRDEQGARLETLATYSNLDRSSEYVERSFDFTRYVGQTIQIAFITVEDHSQPTWFLLDDLTLNITQ